MSVKRYSVGYKDSASGRYASMMDKQDGGYVYYDDYAALEQRLIESERYGRQTDITIDNLEMKLAQMAAENAELISSSECLLHEASEVYRAYNKTQLPDGDLVDEQCLQMVYDAINATPTTDAFLSEVRAQGVEMAVDVVKQCYDNICAGGLQENREYEESIVQPHLDGIDDELNEIIAQLRKGVQS